MKRIIKTETSATIVEKKSKFISYVYKVFSIEEIQSKLTNIKKEYPDSNHICYSYILNENEYKFYDDCEPSSSAGMPIYQCLKNNNLVYTLCIVVRYFGGIKLGLGGLSRAYKKATLKVLKDAKIIKYEELLNYKIICNYKDFDQLEYLLKKYKGCITRKLFNENVEVEFEISFPNFNKILKEYHFNSKPILIKKNKF